MQQCVKFALQFHFQTKKPMDLNVFVFQAINGIPINFHFHAHAAYQRAIT